MSTTTTSVEPRVCAAMWHARKAHRLLHGGWLRWIARRENPLVTAAAVQIDDAIEILRNANDEGDIKRAAFALDRVARVWGSPPDKRLAQARQLSIRAKHALVDEY